MRILFLSFLLLIAKPLAARAAPQPEANLLSLGAGALVVSAPPAYSGWDAFWLLDELPSTGWAQATEGDKGPFPFVFELAGKAQIGALGFGNARVDTEASDARAVKVELADSAKGPWRLAWSGKLQSRKDGQRIPLPAGKVGRYVRLTILSNFGSPSWTELMDIAAYGRLLAPVPVPPLTGRYDTNYGPFRLFQDGIAAAGCYDLSNGLILNGGFEGRVLRFTWLETNGDGSQRGTGPAVMIFPDDGQRFVGYYWNSGSDKIAGRWDGERVASEPGACPHWKYKGKSGAGAELAGQLKSRGRVRLYGILFDTDSDVIKVESRATIEALIAALKSDPGFKLAIEGHTDNAGGDAHNQTLSARRAASVKAALVAGGIDGARLSPQGFGASQPVATNDTALGRSQNRRVEVVRP